MIAINQKFEDLLVNLDGGTFHGCTFTRCRLRFSGFSHPDLSKNTFEQCHWEFAGPATEIFTFLQVLYHDHGGAELGEAIFGRVRDRAPLSSIPHP